MANDLVIPNSIGNAFAKSSGEHKFVFDKPAGNTATVFAASAGSGAALSTLAEHNTGTAHLENGVLHVNLGRQAAAKSATGIAALDKTLVIDKA